MAVGRSARADVSKRAEVDARVVATLGRFGRVDIVIDTDGVTCSPIRLL